MNKVRASLAAVGVSLVVLALPMAAGAQVPDMPALPDMPSLPESDMGGIGAKAADVGMTVGETVSELTAKTVADLLGSTAASALGGM